MGKKKKSKASSKRQKLRRLPRDLPKSVRKAIRAYEKTGRLALDPSSKGLAAAWAIERGAPTPDDMAALEAALDVVAERSESAKSLTVDLMARARELRAAMTDPAKTLAERFGDFPGHASMARAMEKIIQSAPDEDEALAQFIRMALRDDHGQLDFDVDHQAGLKALVAIAQARSGDHPLGPKAALEFARPYHDRSLYSNSNRELSLQVAVAIHLPIFKDPGAMLDTRLSALACAREDEDLAYDAAVTAFLDARAIEGWKIPPKGAWHPGGSLDNAWLSLLGNGLAFLAETTCERLAKALHEDVGAFDEEFLRRILSNLDKNRRRRSLAILRSTPGATEWTSARGKTLAAFVNESLDDSRSARCEDEHREQTGKLFAALVEAGMDVLGISSGVDPVKAAAHWAVTSAVEERQLRDDVQAQTRQRVSGRSRL
jgi:hypothetical protein